MAKSCKVHKNVVQKFELKCQEMTGEKRLSLAVTGRKRQAVQTARHLAECSRKWRLWQGTSDGWLLTDGTGGCAAAAWTTTTDGNDLVGYYLTLLSGTGIFTYGNTHTYRSFWGLFTSCSNVKSCRLLCMKWKVSYNINSYHTRCIQKINVNIFGLYTGVLHMWQCLGLNHLQDQSVSLSL